MLTAEPAIRRCIDARRAQLIARAELLAVSDGEGVEIAFAAVRDEMEFILSLYRERNWALQLNAIERALASRPANACLPDYSIRDTEICDQLQLSRRVNIMKWDEACGITSLEWVISKNLHRRQ